MKPLIDLIRDVLNTPKAVMAISLSLTGLASVLVGISLTSCQTLRSADSNRPPLKPVTPTAEIGTVTALAGISGEPEMRVRIAEGIRSASFSTTAGQGGTGGGGGGFWVVPVATVGGAAGGVVQNSKSELLRGPLEVTLTADAWIVQTGGTGSDALRRYPIREPGKAGTRDLEIEGIGEGNSPLTTVYFNKTPYPGKFRVSLPGGSAAIAAPAAATTAGAPALGAASADDSKALVGTFDVIEHLPLETYLPGVVAKELYRDWPLNAFKVQAVCARSYALHERQRAISAGRRYDVEATTRDQAYGGATVLPVALEAVKQTRGVVLAYQSGILRAYYSSTCGGRAASASDTWPTYKGFEFNLVPPIQGHERESACQSSPLYTWRVERPKDELVRRLALYGQRNGYLIRNIKDLAKIEVARTNATGRPAEYKIVEPGGRWYPLKAEELRLACNTEESGAAGAAKLPAITRQTRVNSGDMEMAVQGSSVVITGRGFGHGVGMCQYCIKAMADRGEPWLATVYKFYPGARVVRAY